MEYDRASFWSPIGAAAGPGAVCGAWGAGHGIGERTQGLYIYIHIYSQIYKLVYKDIKAFYLMLCCLSEVKYCRFLNVNCVLLFCNNSVAHQQRKQQFGLPTMGKLSCSQQGNKIYEIQNWLFSVSSITYWIGYLISGGLYWLPVGCQLIAYCLACMDSVYGTYGLYSVLCTVCQIV